MDEDVAANLPSEPVAGDLAENIEQTLAPDEALLEAGASLPLPLQQLPTPYRREPDGIYLDEEGPKNKVVSHFLCSPLRVLCRVRDEMSNDWGRVVEVIDPAGVAHELLLWMSDAGADYSAWWPRLNSCGLHVTSEPWLKRKAGDIIRDDPADLAIVTKKAGWLLGNSVFVVPSGETIGCPHEPVILASPIKSGGQSGELADWKANVVELCRGSSRLEFAMCASFIPALLGPLGLPTMAFNFFGDSSIGKTKILEVAASTRGNPAALLEGWETTGFAFEQFLQQNNDHPAFLDELGEAPDALLAKIGYLISREKGKRRGARDLTLRESATWRTVILSTSENPLEVMLARKNVRPDPGQLVRFAGVPAKAHAKWGAFEHLQRYGSSGDLADALHTATRKYYGTAFPRFVHELMTAPLQSIVSEADSMIAELASRLCPSDSDGQVRRVAHKFALAAFAGQLASEFEILPLSLDEIEIAASKCFQAWLTYRGTSGDLETDRDIERLREFIQLNAGARFEQWEAEMRTLPTRDRVGFRCEERGHEHAGYYLFPEAFKNTIFGGADHLRAARNLQQRGFLNIGANCERSVVKHVPGIGTTRLYHISLDIIAEASADEEQRQPRRSSRLESRLLKLRAVRSGDDRFCAPDGHDTDQS